MCALANASDAIEILCVSFVLPTAECDLKMTTFDKGLLSSMTFAGKFLEFKFRIKILLFLLITMKGCLLVDIYGAHFRISMVNYF